MPHFVTFGRHPRHWREALSGALRFNHTIGLSAEVMLKACVAGDTGTTSVEVARKKITLWFSSMESRGFLFCGTHIFGVFARRTTNRSVRLFKGSWPCWYLAFMDFICRDMLYSLKTSMTKTEPLVGVFWVKMSPDDLGRGLHSLPVRSHPPATTIIFIFTSSVTEGSIPSGRIISTSARIDLWNFATTRNLHLFLSPRNHLFFTARKSIFLTWRTFSCLKE